MKRKIVLITLSILILLVVGYFVESYYFSEDQETDTVSPILNTDIVKGDWWVPTQEVTWQWQLSGTINTEYDVDIFDIDLVDIPQSTIDKLHSKGIQVICYFSAGSWENFRADAEKFPEEILGNTYSIVN